MNKDNVNSILALLPECTADPGLLCTLCGHFDVSEKELSAAAEALPYNHDLCYEGVRRLLSLILEEFVLLAQPSGKKRCEVTVPAPQILLLALGEAAPGIEFSSSAFQAQIALRSILGWRKPVDLSSCAKRRCGLNKLRRGLMLDPPVSAPEMQLQFGVLCDECVKTGEEFSDIARTCSVSFGKKPYSDSKHNRRTADEFLQRVTGEFGISMNCEAVKKAAGVYSRLLSAEHRLVKLNSRPDREPLFGNSFTLAQSVQLITSPRLAEYTAALELLADELEEKAAFIGNGQERYYCYYIPFLQPEIEKRFRDNGIRLIGNAAFLENGKHMGLDLPGMVAAWLDTLNIRCAPEEECRIIAEAMRECGCTTYLTGAFSFDRRLGAVVPLQRKLLEQQGIRTKLLDSDFWNENEVFGSVLSRVDNICI